MLSSCKEAETFDMPLWLTSLSLILVAIHGLLFSSESYQARIVQAYELLRPIGKSYFGESLIFWESHFGNLLLLQLMIHESQDKADFRAGGPASLSSHFFCYILATFEAIETLHWDRNQNKPVWQVLWQSHCERLVPFRYQGRLGVSVLPSCLFCCAYSLFLFYML